MRKVKTIKKLSKYTGGGVVDLAEPIPTALNEPEQISKFRMDERKRIYQNHSNPQNNLTGLKNTVDDASQKAAIGFQLGGGWGAAAGALSSILLGELDNGGHVNADGSYELSSNFTRLLGVGRSDESVKREASRVRTSNIAMQQTANLQANYKNDPRIEVQPPVLAKDGGVIPKKIKITNTIPEELIHAKISKGELYYDPYNKTLSRVPGSPDKPNTDDDVDAFLAKGGMVVTNNNKQPLINGKTQAIALAPMVDKPNKNMSKGTIEARDRIIKKVTRLNELSKNEGNRTNNIVYANKGYNGLVEHYVDADGVSHSYVFKTGSEKGGFGHRDLSLTANTAGGFGPTLKYGYLGYLSTRQFFPVGKIDYTSQFEGWDKFYTKPVASKPTGVAKSGLSKTSSNKESVPQQGGHFRVQDSIGHRYGYPLLTIADAAEQITTPDKIDMNRIKKDIEYLDGQSKDRSTSNKSNFDLSNLYRGLSAIAPLFDRVRPHTTTLNRPTFKPIPVDVDPTNLLLDAQLGYALNNYNTSHGGFTAGQQLAAANVAASNLATQRANIHQWEKEQELKNITQNIMSYNDYSKLLAEIGNTEIDINDRNRAAANTINDTNRKSALNTLGSIAKEMKQEKIDAQDRERKYTMLEPLIREVYENSDVLLPLLKGKIKKVKKTKKSTKTEKE